MLGMNAYMLIIGRILEENLNYSLTHMSNVLNGIQEHLSKFMEMAVKMNFCVPTVMVGKSKNIILNNYKMNACRNDSNCNKPH